VTKSFGAQKARNMWKKPSGIILSPC